MGSGPRVWRRGWGSGGASGGGDGAWTPGSGRGAGAWTPGSGEEGLGVWTLGLEEGLGAGLLGLREREQGSRVCAGNRKKRVVASPRLTLCPAPRFSLAVVNKAVNLTDGFPYIR